MTPEELEALRLAEEAEAQRLAQEAAATNPIMQPTYLMGQQDQQETVMDTNPLALAGLGGAAAFQGMFPSDSNQQSSETKISTFGLGMGVENQPYVANTDSGIQRGPSNDLLGMDEITKVTDNLSEQMGVPMTGMRPLNPETGQPASQMLIDAALRSGVALPQASVPINAVQTPQPQATNQPSTYPLDVTVGGQQIPTTPQPAAGSPQAFFEQYRAEGPLSQEQIARGEAKALSMGTTFDPDTGFSRDNFLLGQQVPSMPQAPMGVEETRARLGGRTLNQYLNAPDGTEGVYGLRTDPQGRMIPSREGEQATGGLSDYEKASAERYARMDERKRRPGESRTQRDTRLAQGETERTLYGGYTEAQLRDLFGPQNLRAAKAKLSAGVDPITNKRLSDERRDAYDDALKTQILEERLINYRQEDPDKYEKARVLIEKMIQSNQIAPQDGNQYMLRALNLDKKSFDEGSESALMKIIRGVGEGSEGNAGGSEGRSDIPQEAIDALRSNPSKASEFDKYFGQGSSAQFL